jgi:DNA-binding CsgD family transcriptional regulator
MGEIAMRKNAELTPRETEVAELLAWGAAKKEVADQLFISVRTVENTARNIYEKIGIQKATELCVWWFCTHCGVSFDLSPVKRRLLSIALLLIILPQITTSNEDLVRIFRGRKTQSAWTCRVIKSGRRRGETIEV